MLNGEQGDRDPAQGSAAAHLQLVPRLQRLPVSGQSPAVSNTAERAERGAGWIAILRGSEPSSTSPAHAGAAADRARDEIPAGVAEGHRREARIAVADEPGARPGSAHLHRADRVHLIPGHGQRRNPQALACLDGRPVNSY